MNVERVIVHPTDKGWTWSQIGPSNGVAAVSPTHYDNKGNAHRAAKVQSSKLRYSRVERVEDMNWRELAGVRRG